MEYRYRPDICGVTRQWRMIEVEVKLTLSDLRNNRKKRHLEFGAGFPSQFYFAVPPDLGDAAKELLADGDGLLTWGGDGPYGGPSCLALRPATKRTGQRLNKYSAMRAVMHQSATLHRAAVYLSKLADGPETGYLLAPRAAPSATAPNASASDLLFEADNLALPSNTAS